MKEVSEAVRKQMREGLSPDKRLAWDLIAHVHEMDVPNADKIAALTTTLAFLVGIYIKDDKDVAEAAEFIRKVIVDGGEEAKRISNQVDAGGEQYVNAELKKMGIQMPGVGEA